MLFIVDNLFYFFLYFFNIYFCLIYMAYILPDLITDFSSQFSLECIK